MQALSALLSGVKSSENPSEIILKEFIPTWERFASSCRGQIHDCMTLNIPIALNC